MQYCPDGRLLTSPISSLVLSRALEGAAIPGHLSPPHPFLSIHPSIHPPPFHLRTHHIICPSILPLTTYPSYKEIRGTYRNEQLPKKQN
ncbi:hypothetical protein H8958_004573, partial [Nasalis larvatus]